ncbi:MAG: RdgB/HAM1 family non-canonical purine NTP pyrophosphatase [Bacillota bacterium]
MQKIRVIAATNNAHKLVEMRDILGDKFEVVSLKEIGVEVEVEEDGATFYANALKKAREICKITKEPALADDSGLMVEALAGAPGVFSARYAGEICDDSANNIKLLNEMQGVENRKAKFVSSIVLFYPNGNHISAVGDVKGYILDSLEGENGFGYDPLFYSTDLEQSFGVATSEEKNAVSHRGRALTKLAKMLV